MTSPVPNTAVMATIIAMPTRSSSAWAWLASQPYAVHDHQRSARTTSACRIPSALSGCDRVGQLCEREDVGEVEEELERRDPVVLVARDRWEGPAAGWLGVCPHSSRCVASEGARRCRRSWGRGCAPGAP